MINVCQLISCPFANINPKPGSSSGCTRYSTSYHCHLRQNDPTLQPNEYWLFGTFSTPGGATPLNLKVVNDLYIQNDESSQRRLWAMANLDD